MYLYKYFLIMTFINLHFHETSSISNKELVIQKRGVDLITPCSAGLVLYTELNNTSNEVDLEVQFTPDECCLGGSDEDCDVVEVIGDCVETIPRGTTKLLKLVAPLIDPYERNGYCMLYLDSKPRNRQRGTMRDAVKIPFDTRLKNKKQPMEVPDNITACSRIDEDPFNDCRPVDCETYYNGKRPYFDRKARKCTNAPNCVPDNEDEVPNVIYDFKKNKCVIGSSISNKDIDLIKELSGGNQRKAKDIIIIKGGTKPPEKLEDFFKTFTTKGPYEDYLIELDKEKINQIKKMKEQGQKFFMAKYFLAHRWTLLFFMTVIIIQCCLMCTMIYWVRCKSGNYENKRVVRRFFNYRQDASVTTPLICTSNIDTETTEFQYFSESSNIDKKIKCYKACQKERKNNAKMVMSDDILSKCLTRRDWNSKPAKSEAIPETTNAEDNKRNTETLNGANYQSNLSNQSRKASNVKVNFENENQKPKKEKKSSKIVNSIVKKIDSRYRTNYNANNMEDELSEKEIKCHSYDNNDNFTGFKPSANSKKIGFLKEKCKKGTISVSTEKGAQASFSNDSIDDFLSEKGLIFLAGEDFSKYSFASRSDDANPSSLSSEVSSKTSKNNVVKNVLSLLHRKSKHGPSSDPGTKKDSNLDVELIHMSHASVYSSNNGSDYMKSLKITKDSRSSL